MFCSVKKDKKNNRYSFYLCDRYRDKETGKVKSSDKYIITLQGNEILNSSNEETKQKIDNAFINKGISLHNMGLLLDKIINLRNSDMHNMHIRKLNDVVIENDNTTINNNVVVQDNNTTYEKVEIVQAEIIEGCRADYKTTIYFDVQQDYSRNIKESLNFNSIMKAFGGNTKDRFEIEEEELNKIQEQGESIKNKIDNIYLEYLDINKQNKELQALGSDIRLIQDIYISCYNKVPTSEVWLIGGGYIERIFNKADFILPGQGKKLYEEWEEIKKYNNLEDNKAYFNREEYFEEIDLYRTSTLYIDAKDITGSLIRLILSGNCEIEYSSSDWIDIKIGKNTIGLSIEHLVDWINNKPTVDYKVSIEDLMDYKEQLYKYKEIRK